MRFRVASVIVLALLLGGCAKANAKLVLTEDAVHDALARVDDQVRTVCTGAQAEALKPACSDVRTALVPALEAGAAFNRAVAAQKLSGLAPLMESVGKLTTAVKRLPQGQTGEIVLELGRAIAAAYAEVKR